MAMKTRVLAGSIASSLSLSLLSLSRSLSDPAAHLAKEQSIKLSTSSEGSLHRDKRFWMDGQRGGFVEGALKDSLFR